MMDVDSELTRLRAEVERLTDRAAMASLGCGAYDRAYVERLRDRLGHAAGIPNPSCMNVTAVMPAALVTIERLTRERDDRRERDAGIYLRALAKAYLAADPMCPANEDGTGEWSIDDVADAVSALADEHAAAVAHRNAAIRRAETAERERAEAQREVCRRRVRDNGPRFGGDEAVEQRARELAERLEWDCFDAPGNCDECPGENGQHAMSCGRGSGEG